MDSERFDGLVRAWGDGTSRRGVLAATLAGLGLACGAVTDAHAGRGRGKTKRRRKHAQGTPGAGSRHRDTIQRQAQGQDTITICHKPGTAAEKTLHIAAPAVAAHLAHGDTLGACGAACDVNACPPPSAPCREAFCTSEGVCGERAAIDGTPCQNANLCTVSDVCRDGVCTDGLRTFCQAPPEPCREAFCNPATGECEVRDKERFTPCDDGDPCTERDSCDGGVCVGIPVQCVGERVCCRTGPFRGQCKGDAGDRCFGNSECCNENCVPFANVCSPFV